MSKGTLKSIEFHGQPIYYVSENGRNYVIIRSICEVLGLDSEWQVKAINDNEILGDERCFNTVRLPSDDRSRKYTCLPEEMVYGWLFGVQMSGNMKDETKANLIAYKMECYHILYQHFHGKIAEAQAKLKQRAVNRAARSKLHMELIESNPTYQKLHQLDYDYKLMGSPFQKYQNEQYKLFMEDITDQPEVQNN